VVDVLTHGDESLQDPGDDLQADIVLDTTAATVSVAGATQTVTVPLGDDVAAKSLRQETLLGALLGGMIDARLTDVKARQVLAARRRMLEGLDDDHTEALLAALQQGLDGGGADDAASADSVAAADQPLNIERRTPDAVRHLARDDDHYASLPRFWDQLGSVFRDGHADDLTPDPYFATGTMPPLSSTFRDLSPMRRMLPVFDPTLCTGCGNCWTVCPDSAIGVAALRPAALLDAGIKMTGADAVRQVSGKIAARIVVNGKAADASAVTFGEMLDTSYGWLKDKMPLPDDRKQAIDEGLARIREQLGELPVAVTEPFFNAAEAQQKDSAELLSLAINPDACKACSICVDSCEPGALSAREQDPALLQRAHTLWSAWSAAPDTAGATVERAAAHAGLGVLPALLLSRYCQFALAGGDSAEAGSGEKIAVRQLLAATEYHQQPVVQRFANALHEAGESLTALIRETLSTTLAVDDLDAVTEQLERTSSPRVDLKTLAEGTGDLSSDHTIDTDYVLRLLDLSKQITSAHHRFVKGKHGLGRARYGIAVAGDISTAWAATFPHNPFQAPALIDLSGDAAGLAAGLVEGQLEETTAFARLLRLARLEIEQPDGLDWQRQKLGTLRWQDLSDEEHALCPPLLLIGSDAMLAGQGLSQLIGILNSGLPVKVLLLHALDFGLASDPATVAERAPSNNSRSSLSLLALAQRNAFVAQTSVADPVHLGDSVLAALAFDGPALLQVYAPSPTRHGFDSNQTVEQALSAVQCRVLPVFRYDPGADGVFGARLDLAGNPQLAELLSQTSDDSPPATPADWALRQQRFRNCFEPLRSDAGTPLALHEWLQLESNQRSNKAPYVVSGDGDEAQQFAVKPGMLAMTEQCIATWQTLQEIAGIVTPFTARLEQDIRTEVAAEHAAELAALKQESEAQVAAVKEQVEAEVASKIRSRLMDLASRKRS
jgi:pyruvate-ferredoxin/flavodoxin oxidoreductase